MIYWSCSDFAQYGDDANLRRMESRLGAREAAEYSRLKVAKRQKEWLVSRSAVKALIRALRGDISPSGDQCIETVKNASGVPHVEIGGRQIAGQLSLSHSRDKVVCAFSVQEVPLGVDIEKIESRSPEFVDDYFTEAEAQQVVRADPSDKDLIATLIWSGKEAVLKALSLGLNLDTRSIEIQIDAPERLPARGWHKLEILSAVKQASPLCLFWRSEDDYVLTLCTLSGQALDFVRLDPGVSDLQADIGEPGDRS